MSWLDFLTDCFTTVTMGLIPRAESDEEKVKQAQHEANMQHAQMNPQKLTEIKNTNEQTQKNEQKKEIDNKIGNSNINTNYDDARFEYNNKLSNVQSKYRGNTGMFVTGAIGLLAVIGIVIVVVLKKGSGFSEGEGKNKGSVRSSSTSSTASSSKTKTIR